MTFVCVHEPKIYYSIQAYDLKHVMRGELGASRARFKVVPYIVPCAARNWELIHHWLNFQIFENKMKFFSQKDSKNN